VKLGSVSVVLQRQIDPHPAKVIFANPGVIILGAPVFEQLQPFQHLFATGSVTHSFTRRLEDFQAFVDLFELKVKLGQAQTITLPSGIPLTLGLTVGSATFL